MSCVRGGTCRFCFAMCGCCLILPRALLPSAAPAHGERCQVSLVGCSLWDVRAMQ